MIGKKGEEIVLPTLLKTILAIISIVILGYLAVEMYSVLTFNSKIGEATSLLEDVLSKVDYMNKNNVTEENLIISTPHDWYLLGISGYGKKLCVCKELSSDADEQKEMCASDGVCMDFEQPIEIVTSALDGNIKLENIREIFIYKEGDNIFIYTQEKQIKHKSYLNDFLEREITIGDKKLKVYEQMIEVVEGRSKIGIEDSATALISEFDEIFGERGWAIRYSKEGSGYPWNYIHLNVWEIAQGYTSSESPGNIETALEEKITYDGGVLKIQMRVLNKN